ncbi:MAG: HAD hydrolase-like protein [Alphaproteobacteria bacterium]|nr:HAD hydrolase-like protein [Alphaproteobacteria bacterium]
MKDLKSIFEIADKYDAFFVDVYGVLFDGISLCGHAIETLQKLKEQGKKIIILSNTTQISEDAKNGSMQRGMMPGDHYDEFITSGEFLHQTIKNTPSKFCEIMGSDVKTVKCIFMGNNNIFADTFLKKTDNYDDADFLYVGIPRISYGAVRMDDVVDEDGNCVNIEDIMSSDWHKLRDEQGRRGFEEFAHQLELCLEKGKTLLLANPDIFAHGSIDNSRHRVPIVTQGCIGRYYEKLGGKVVKFGKPFSSIFEFAKKSVNTERIAMIGDTPWTDILGANAAGIDSIMITTGVAQEFFKNMPVHLHSQEKLNILLEETSLKMAGSNSNFEPTFVLEKLC